MICMIRYVIMHDILNYNLSRDANILGDQQWASTLGDIFFWVIKEIWNQKDILERVPYFKRKKVFSPCEANILKAMCP